MKKLSQIISSTVISLFESEEVGIVYDAIFDYKTKKCKYVCILNEESNIIYSLNYQNVVSFGKDCTYIKNSSALELLDNLALECSTKKTPLNQKIYTLEGDYLGTCRDIEIDEDGNLINLILEDFTIGKNKIINIGSVIIVGNENVKIAKFKPTTKIKSNNTPSKDKVVILSEPTSQPTQPQNKIITDSRFLLGRKVDKDIIATNGEIIARAGATITKGILACASSYGKLIEVTRHCTN